MPIEVTMPRLSDTMESGTVVKWNVKEGDTVSTGDVLADIETDKATMELESFDDGTVAKLAVPEGESVAVGEIILILAEEGEDASEAAESAAKSDKSSAKKQESGESSTATAEPKAKTKSDSESDSESDDQEPKDESPDDSTEPKQREPDQPTSNGRVFASPLARKIASEKGVDLAAINGSGPSGRIVKKDVEAAAVAPASSRSSVEPASSRSPSTSAPDFDSAHASTVEAATKTAAPGQPTLMQGPTLEARTVPLSNMRETIARRLVESKQTIPHYQVSVDADMDALLALRKQLNNQLESQNVKLSVNDFLVRACALAMHQHPFVNSRWKQEGEGKNTKTSIEILPDVNVAIAIALPQERGGGLVVATLKSADRMGLRAISSESKRLSKKAREKGLTLEEMSDGTFTISNLGMFGVSHFTAIINPPQVAILAVGAAQQRPVVKDNELTIGNVMTMTMSSDHRVVDGAMAAQYLATTRELLENPATLLV